MLIALGFVFFLLVVLRRRMDKAPVLPRHIRGASEASLSSCRHIVKKRLGIGFASDSLVAEPSNITDDTLHLHLPPPDSVP